MTFFDVCIFNAFALSNTAKLLSAYQYHERRKFAKFAESDRDLVDYSSFIPQKFPFDLIHMKLRCETEVEASFFYQIESRRNLGKK